MNDLYSIFIIKIEGGDIKMDDETYEAIKRLIGYAKAFHASNVDEDIKVVEEWIAKVAKERGDARNTDAEIQG